MWKWEMVDSDAESNQQCRCVCDAGVERAVSSVHICMDTLGRCVQQRVDTN